MTAETTPNAPGHGCPSGPEDSGNGCLFSRRAVLDERDRVRGYLLTAWSRAENEPRPTCPCQVFLPTLVPPGKRIYISLRRQDLPACLTLPPDMTVIMLREPPPPDTSFLVELRDMREKGYAIGIEDFRAELGHERFLALADAISVSFALNTAEDALEVVARAQKSGPEKLTILATDLKDRQSLAAAAEAGCTLFSGPYLTRPETVAGRAPTPNQLSRLKLFSLVEKPEADLDELVDAVAADVAISFRLLQHLNTPVHDLTRKVTSLRQAIIMLGWKAVKEWLRVAILADLPRKGKSSELATLSIQRGKFFECLALALPAHAKAAEERYLLGLFSLLDTMLDVEMNQLTAALPLTEENAAALQAGTGPHAPWLQLARAFERSDWSQVVEAAAALHAPLPAVAAAYHEASVWTSTHMDVTGKS